MRILRLMLAALLLSLICILPMVGYAEPKREASVPIKTTAQISPIHLAQLAGGGEEKFKMNQKIRSSLPGLKRTLEQSGVLYGDVFMDDDKVIVQLLDDSEANKKQVRDLFDFADHLIFQKVKYSGQELTKAKEKLEQLTRDSNEIGGGIDSKSNKILIILSNSATDADRELVKKSFDPEMVDIQQIVSVNPKSE